MGCRRQSRNETNVTVNLCGTDAKGRAFVTRARTRNMSPDGALLEGVQSQVRPGDVLVLRCEQNTGRFRVVWESGYGEHKLIGLTRVVPAGHADEAGPSLIEPDSFQRPRVQVRRQQPRYKCEVAAELHLKNAETSVWLTTLNLSESGCAVESLSALPADTRLSIAIWIDDAKLWAEGLVVNSQYGFGTGIKFTAMTRTSREQLREFLERKGATISERREMQIPSESELEKILVSHERDLQPGREEFVVSMPLLTTKDRLVLG